METRLDDSPMEADGKPRIPRHIKGSSLLGLAVSMASLFLAFVVGSFLTTGAGVTPRGTAAAPPVDACALFDHEHVEWTAILEGFVRDGRVDYAGLKRSAEDDLSVYLRHLRSICPTHYGEWTKQQKLAFWINAYNAHTIRLILDHYPIASIRSIGWVPGSAFHLSFIRMPAFGPGDLSLDDIEHKILRAQIGDPRVHFALVCASMGCPALLSEAYRASEVDSQLDEAARRFVRDTTKNRFDPASRMLHLSSIFKWFREDFERTEGTLSAYVARYSEAPAAAAIRSGAVQVTFLDYDWSLNGR